MNNNFNILSALRDVQDGVDQLMSQVEDMQVTLSQIVESLEDDADVLYIWFSPEHPPRIVLGETGLNVITDEELCMAQECTTGLMAFYAQNDAVQSVDSLCLAGPVLLASFDDEGVPLSVTPTQFRAVQKLYAQGRTTLAFGPASIEAIKMDVHEGT